MSRHPYEEELERAGVDPRLRKIAHDYFKGERVADVILCAIIVLPVFILVVFLTLWAFSVP